MNGYRFLLRVSVIGLLGCERTPGSAGFEPAADRAGAQTRVADDLAAGHWTRFETASDPEELLAALAAADRAVRLDPHFPSARLHRALALSAFSLRSQAAADWADLAAHATDPAQRREARQRADQLARSPRPHTWEEDRLAFEEAFRRGDAGRIRALVAASPQRFREHVDERLFVRWASAQRSRNARAAQAALDRARSLATALCDTHGEATAYETVLQIDRERRRPGAALGHLIAGFAAYGEGVKLADKERYSTAVSRFRSARRFFLRAKSPFAGWASYQIAHCRYQQNRYAEAKTELLRLAAAPTPGGARAFQLRGVYLQGLIEGIEGHLTAALVSYRSALGGFESLGERALVAKTQSQLAETWSLLGQPSIAWKYLRAALLEPATLSQPQVRRAICGNAAQIAGAQGELEVALLFQDETLRTLSAGESPAFAVGTLRSQAGLLTELGWEKEARSALAQAWRLQREIRDPKVRRDLEGNLRLVEGRLAGTADPAAALRNLDAAVEIFRDTSYHFALGQAFFQRALVARSLGERDRAERDLRAAMAESERQRKTIESKEDRIAYFDRTRKVFDVMVDFQLTERNRPEEAFRFSELSKARVLWDWLVSTPSLKPETGLLGGAGAPAAGLTTLRAGLPAGTVVIDFMVLPDKLVVWVLRRDGPLICSTRAIPATRLASLIERLHRNLVYGRSREANVLGRSLYDLLVGPVSRHIRPGDRLVFVPDASLHRLPFSALRNGERYLVEDYALAVSPSVHLFLASLRRDRNLIQAAVPRALVVTEPAFDSEIDSSLRPLGAGDTESRIAGLFPGSLVQRGTGASRQAFLHAAGSFEIVYFGGHSRVNVRVPSLSQMLFAPAPGDSDRGVLYSAEVLRHRFSRTRLLILASCRTGTGKISGTEGVESLARPFLATGVPAVVASLWPVQDQRTAAFFERFHFHLRANFDVAEALRSTQVEWIQAERKRGSRNLDWSAFEAIGGGGWSGPPLR
jgi:CHAT domain-containing protein